MSDFDHSASTFNGIIHEIPDILIDNFSSYKESQHKYCFISHAHDDHFKNVNVITIPSRIVTTSTTKELIGSRLPKFFKTYPVNECIELEKGLTFSFIPNYHCIGSMMILIHDSRTGLKRVLYTGDARFSPEVLASINCNPILSPYVHGKENLDWIYLDTTFTYRADLIDIVDNSLGIEMLLNEMDKYPRGTTFKFVNTTLGFEEVWLRIQQRFTDCCFKFVDNIYQRIDIAQKCIPNETMINILSNVSQLKLEKNVDQPRFTIIFGALKDINDQFGKNDNDVVIRQAIDLSKEHYTQFYTPVPKDSKDFTKTTTGGLVKPSDKHPDIHKIIYQLASAEYKFNYFLNDNTYYPLELKCMYSRHSSYRETYKFMKMFSQIGDIWPNTQAEESIKRGLSIKRLFGIENAAYDLKHFKVITKDKLIICNLWDQIQLSNLNWDTIYYDTNFNSISTIEDPVESKNYSTDEDKFPSVVGLHKRIKSFQQSIDDNNKGLNKANIGAIQARIINTRDHARGRFAMHKVKKTEWVVVRQMYKSK